MRPENRRNWAVSAMVLIILVVAFLWMNLNPPAPEGEEIDGEMIEETVNTVEIGVMSPTSETYSAYMFLAELAQEEINEYCKESLIDYQFKFVLTCAEGMAGNALELTRQYHACGINLVVGYGWSSHLCSGAREYAEENGMVLLSPSSTSPIYAVKDHVFRLCPNDFMVIHPLAKTMWSIGVTDVVVFHRGDAWGDGLVEGLKAEYEKIGGRIPNVVRYTGETEGAGFRSYVERADDALQEIVKEVGEEHAAVLLLSFSEAVDILRESGGFQGLMNVTWFGVESTARSEMIRENASKEAMRVKLISLDVDLPETEVYRWVNEAFGASLNRTLSFYNANIYDGCWIMALSVIEANMTNASAIIDVLPRVALNYTGASGNCHLDENGDRDTMDYALWGYFEVDGECTCLKCGTYHNDSDEVEWDKTIVCEAK